MIHSTFSSAHAVEDIHGWGYQLQSIDIGQVAAAPCMDLAVLDYSSDGPNGSRPLRWC